MANKIVQLQNKDGDNIFPVSAGLASDSVTTDMIQDGAVTSAKIDYETFPFLELECNLNQNVAWTTTGNITLLEGNITLDSRSRVRINGTVAVNPTSYGVRIVMQCGTRTLWTNQYIAISTGYTTLTATKFVDLEPGTYPVRLILAPDGFSDAAGSARCFSLNASAI